MLSILISILAGCTITLIIMQVFIFLKDMHFEKKRVKDSSSDGPLTRIVLYTAMRIGSLLKKRNIPIIQQMSADIEGYIQILGKPYTQIDSSQIIGLQIVAALFAAFILGIISRFSPFLMIIGIAGGFYLPLLGMKNKVKVKQEKIVLELPDILDLLTLMLESGTDFSNALQKINISEQGVLISELRAVEEEIALGKSRIQALSDMANRLNNPALTSVVHSITISMKSGSSMAKTLSALSEQFRVERTQYAEKQAATAPLKLLFPLLIFIFPTIFMVIFGPIILSFVYKS